MHCPRGEGGRRQAGTERGKEDDGNSCSGKRGQGQHRPIYKSGVDLPSVLRQLFARGDADQNGFLDASELAVLVRDVSRTFHNVMSDAEVRCAVKNLLCKVGKGLDGTLTCEEFMTYLEICHNTLLTHRV